MLDRIRESLGAKVILAVTAVLALSISAMAYVDYRNETRYIIESHKRNARLLANTIEKGLVSAMKEGRNRDVQKALDDIGSQEGIAGVRIFDPKGGVMRSTNKGEVGGLVDKATLELYRSGIGGEAFSEDGGETLSYVKPIYNGPSCFICHPASNKVNGVIEVKVSMQGAYEEIASNRSYMFKWGGVTLLFVALSEVVLLRRLVTGRVARLRRAMRKAQQGEPYELELSYPDEIGQLGEVFKGMLERISVLNREAIDRERDLTRSQEAVKAQSILSSVIDAMPDGVAIINHEMRLVQTNPRHREIFPQAKVGEACYFCIHQRSEPCPHCGLVKVFDDGKVHDHHSSVTLPDGSTRVVHSISGPILDERGAVISAVEVVRDVTERVMLEREIKEKSWELERANKKLARMAVTDGLTMLFNRRYFQDSLTREFRRLARHRALPLLALAMIDIDDFKDLNDTHGHQAGDYVLKGIGRILKGCIRLTDTVARYGGEEFVVIMPETDREGMTVVAERIRKAVEEADFSLQDVRLKVTVSIGLACYPDGSVRAEDDLVKAADDALYKAKQGGKNRIVIAQG